MTPAVPARAARPLRCSEAADRAGDAREGTAAPAAQWFLLEHPGPWGRNALTDSGIDRAAVASLTTWSAQAWGRVLLVRRPGRAGRDGAPRRWFRVDARPGHEQIRTGLVGDEASLEPGAAGEPFDGPLFLACTHGKHDPCCAIRGRSLAAALAAEQPRRVWECTHVGGCRFAPALVLLPHGFVLGGVPPEEAADVTRAYEAGVVDDRFVRGRSTDPPAVQAAQHHARAALGVAGTGALRLVSVEETGDVWHVRLADPGCTVLMRERREPAGRPLTCASTTPGWLRTFDLVALTEDADIPRTAAR